MDYRKSFEISAAGMAVERARVEVAALNLANANTVQTADGASYQPARVVARSSAGLPAVSFADHFELGLDEGRGSGSVSLPEASLEPTLAAPRMVYEPGHPLANPRGFVAYPGVDPATEMVSLMTAVRAYEANVAALNSARTLALRALDIGGGA
jgi:flagellar basal-body rod protein FlgC